MDIQMLLLLLFFVHCRSWTKTYCRRLILEHKLFSCKELLWYQDIVGPTWGRAVHKAQVFHQSQLVTKTWNLDGISAQGRLFSPSTSCWGIWRTVWMSMSGIADIVEVGIGNRLPCRNLTLHVWDLWLYKGRWQTLSCINKETKC